MTAASGNHRLTTLLPCAHARTVVLNVATCCIFQYHEPGYPPPRPRECIQGLGGLGGLERALGMGSSGRFPSSRNRVGDFWTKGLEEAKRGRGRQILKPSDWWPDVAGAEASAEGSEATAARGSPPRARVGRRVEIPKPSDWWPDVAGAEALAEGLEATA